MKNRNRFVGNWIFYGLIVVIGCVAGALLAQPGGPVFSVKEVAHDFGTVEANAELKHSFEIENTGQQPLKIKSVVASCGCIKDAHIEEDTVMTGHKTKLNVTWESSNFEREIKETIEVFSNDPKNPMHQFTIMAKVAPRFEIEPAVANFGIVEEDSIPQTEEVTIRKNIAGTEKDEIECIYNKTFLQCKVEKISPKEWKLALTLQPDAPLGPIDGQVTVTPSWAGPRRLQVLGKLVSNIAAEPEEIYIDTSLKKAGTEVIKIIAEKNNVARVKLLSITPELEKAFQVVVNKGELAVTYNLPALTSPKVARGMILFEVGFADGHTKKVSVPIIIEH